MRWSFLVGSALALMLVAPAAATPSPRVPLPVLHGAGALGSGTYAVWTQETGGPASYGFDFVIDAALPPVQPVPLPTGALLMLSSLGAIALTKRRKDA